MINLKQTILVAGLGLIGGSLAKNLMQSEDNFVIGYDISETTLNFAKINHIIHEIADDFESAASRADIIILASPISITIELIARLDAVRFEKDVIVTDVCSVKGSILEAAAKLTNEKIVFIGGHPMAGSHKKGVQAAKTHLFENAIYVLTPTNNCATEKVELLKETLKNTKSRFIILQPNEHDEMTGVVSHFPHLIASSLVHQAKKWQEKHSYLPELAAGGFRDITRIASSNPIMWQDIFYHNQGKMACLLEEWIEEMTSLKNMLVINDKHGMTDYLKQAKDYRDGLGTKEKGAMPSFYDLVVDIRDETGALASVVQLLADAAISITNIRILEIREALNGALRLSVTTKDAQIKAAALLKENGYETMIEA